MLLVLLLRGVRSDLEAWRASSADGAPVVASVCCGDGAGVGVATWADVGVSGDCRGCSSQL